MNASTNQPVEISTKMQEGEWTEESLQALVGSYQGKLREMGAPEEQIHTAVEPLDDGAVNILVSWQRRGTHIFAGTGQGLVEEEENSRGQGEHIPAGEVTQDSKGLGAVFGDAERSAIDAPPTERAVQAEKDQLVPELLVTTDDDGNSHVQDVGTPKS